MSVLLRRILLAAALMAVPAVALAETDAKNAEDGAATAQAGEEAAEPETPDGDSDGADDGSGGQDEAGDDDEADDEAEDVADEDAEWAEKLRRRHHEGDVALGVCGGRMSALMWFYEASVADGRDDLKPAYEAVKESRAVLKKEAERRAVEDGVGTSVSVMNEQGQELWKTLVEATEKPETFQEAHDELFAGVQECLTLFFRRGAVASSDAGDAADDSGEVETEDDAKAAD